MFSEFHELQAAKAVTDYRQGIPAKETTNRHIDAVTGKMALSLHKQREAREKELRAQGRYPGVW